RVARDAKCSMIACRDVPAHPPNHSPIEVRGSRLATPGRSVGGRGRLIRSEYARTEARSQDAGREGNYPHRTFPPLRFGTSVTLLPTQANPEAGSHKYKAVERRSQFITSGKRGHGRRGGRRPM